jgi:hypothetical protein
MAFSYVTYNGDGSNRDFSVTFGYIDKTHIKVYVGGVEDTTFTWVNDTMVRTTSTPSNGVVVKIQRITPKTALTDFVNASTLNEADLDRSLLQAIFVAAEAFDEVEANMSLDTDDRWDAQNKRIKNVADPVNPQDAATKQWSETSGSSFVSQAQAQAQAAATSASAAATSATNAATSASTASTQASNASTSATNAANSASAAATSATNAANSATTATTKASEAATSATNAQNSANAAATSATNAATSATNASNSASAAATSASNAAASYDNFDDRYLGAKASNPTLDNDGNALLTGALYFNTTSNEMRVYTGSTWVGVNPASALLKDGSVAVDASYIPFNEYNSTPAAVEVARVDSFIYNTTPGGESGGLLLRTKTAGGAISTMMEVSDNVYCFGDEFTLSLTQDSASANPVMTLHRGRTTAPAADDFLASLRWTGEDSLGNFTTYGNIVGQIVNPTDGAEKGRLNFYARNGGSATTKVAHIDTDSFTVEVPIRRDGYAVGTPPVAYQEYSASATGTTTIPLDNTIPQNTEGTEFMSVTITPDRVGDKILVEAHGVFSHSNNLTIVAALFVNNDANAVAVAAETTSVGGHLRTLILRYMHTVTDLNPITFKVRAGGSGTGTITFNGLSGTQRFGSTIKSMITAREIFW